MYDHYFAICDDTLNCILNYLPIYDIYKLKSLNKQFNDFIDNRFILTNYYCNKLNKNIIEKHKNNLNKIICVYCDNSINWDLNDRDLMGLNKLNALVLPFNNKITDEGLKYISNIQYLDFYYNENIIGEGLKYIINIECLDVSYSNNITDEGLKYIPNVQHLHFY